MKDEMPLLKQRVAALEKELEERQKYISILEKANKDLESKLSTAEDSGAAAPLTELEETLRRLVGRVAMILQAEKCVFMVYDKEAGELVAKKPALGFTDEQVKAFRVRATEGVSGKVFRERKPYILYDALNDDLTLKENVALLGVRNGVTVPLIVEKRDEDNRVIEERPIGVLHVFNRRYGNVFIEEDLRLLERLAKNHAAVIASAQMYEEVIERKEELESIIESVYAGLIVVGRRGRIMQMNPSARTMLGLDNQDVQGQAMEDVVTNEKVIAVLSQSLNENLEIAQEIAIGGHNPSEEKIYQVQTALVRGDDQSIIGVVAIFNDITEIRSIERIKTAFVSTVSHELRTPLTSIKGFIATLLADTDGYYDSDTKREFYTIIDIECDRLTRLISDLLNVSRIEAGRALQLNLKPVKLNDLIEKVVTAQKSYATKHDFVVEIEELPEVTADEDKVDQILTNLISNAIKYSPRGGVITLRSKREDDESVLISVSDQGIGIPKEHQNKVFDRFHRVDNRDTREAGGTGIGLFLVKHLVDAHHGDIWVESEVGKGSTFTFRLPINPEAEEE